MIKYFIFLANASIDHSSFEGSIYSLMLDKPKFVYENDHKGYFFADASISAKLSEVLFDIHDTLGMNITIIVSHKKGALEEKLLNKALSYFPNQCLYLTDMLLKELSFGDYSSFPLLSAEFRGIDEELMLTAGTFLRCDLNASLTSETLFIHRNTFNYRLNSFIEKTSLDIRDYHNALLLELYFQLASKH